MPAHAPAIFLSDQRWSLGVLDADGSPRRITAARETGAAPLEQAAAVLRLLDEHRARVKDAVLALPSAWCLAAPIATDGLLKRQRRDAMLYRLEEKLPLDAEELAADFIAGPHAALGVCVPASRVSPALEALTGAGMRIGAVCPQALLALQTLRTLPEAPATAIYLLQLDDRVDLLLVRDNVLRRWASVATAPHAVATALRRERLDVEEACPLISVGLSDKVRAALDHADLLHLDTPSLDEAMIHAAACIVVRGERPLINLRRGPLAPADPLQQVQRPLTAAVLGVALLLVCLISAALWRAHHYDQFITQIQHQQQAAFREAFPGQAPPGAVLARLRSEARKLRGVRGADDALPQSPATLALLQKTLAALPTDLRYRVLELRLDEQRLYLDGQARSHADANALANALRRGTQLNVQPPPTENLPDGGVAFTLTAPLDAASEARP